MKKSIKLILAPILVALFFALDIITPLGVAGGVPYVVFVAIGYWYKDKRVVLAFGAIGILLTVVGYHISQEGEGHWMVLLNRTYAIMAIGTITFLGYYSKSLETVSEEIEGNEMSIYKLDLESRRVLIFISFIIGLAIVAVGLLSIHLLQRTSEYTQIMYNNPLTMSNAAKDIRINMNLLHKEMEEFVAARDSNKMKIISISIVDYIKKTEKLFQIVDQEFLNNTKNKNLVYAAFLHWKKTKDSVFLLMEAGKFEAATQLLKSEGANQAAFLDKEIQHIIDLALYKASKINQAAIEDNHNIKILMSVLIGVVLLFGAMAVFILDSSRVKRLKAQADLEKMNVFLEDRIQERTNDLLSALEHAKEINAIKSRFVTMASHEFRTPLSSILSSVSLIDKYTKEAEQEKRKKHIDRIKASVKNMTEILTDFLSIDQLEQGKIVIHKETFDFPILCSEVIAEVSASKKEGQVISHQYEGHIVIIGLDKKMLRNILTNLLSNAVKYSPQGYPIQLYTKVEEKQILIQVKDQGIGVPKEDQKYLFEPFFRATNVTNISGTGLGLNITKYLSEMMGGTLSYTSEEGKGSTFTVKFTKSNNLHKTRKID